MKVTDRPFCRTIAACASFAALTLPLILPWPAQAQPPIAQWMRVNDKQIGVSFLMPPGAAVEPKAFNDPKTGTKIASLQAKSEKDGQGGYFYLTMVFRVNKAGAATLKAKTNGQNDALVALVMKPIAPLIDGMAKDVKAHPGEATMTRKPLTALGMQGEQIDATRLNPKTHRTSYMKIHILKSEDNIVLLVGGAHQTPENEATTQKYFDSFKLSPTVPFESHK